MKFYSTNNKTHSVSFQEAIFKGLSPDNGLYFPEKIPYFGVKEIDLLLQKSNPEIAFTIAQSFVENEIELSALQKIVENTTNFPIPLKKVEPNIYALELFHGPTWAFKDTGARFLAGCLSYFTQKTGKEITILVATSGDTGGAVASGFYEAKGVKVFILYPKGKVTEVQKQQLTTLGKNIEAFEVDGTFDDCQRMVKEAFLDLSLTKKYFLSSANSINIARLIPQSFYYFFAVKMAKELNFNNLIFSVPSGNYGNLTAGLMAWKMGLPIKKFIAAGNQNHVFQDYLATGNYTPKPSIRTYANAMDVGNPSNFVRILELFENKHSEIIKMIDGFYIDDPTIIKALEDCYQKNSYLLDPHGSIGYLSLKERLKKDEVGIFLETAHPIKFLDVFEKTNIDVLSKFKSKVDILLEKKASFQSISSHFSEFKDILMSR